MSNPVQSHSRLRPCELLPLPGALGIASPAAPQRPVAQHNIRVIGDNK